MENKLITDLFNGLKKTNTVLNKVYKHGHYFFLLLTITIFAITLSIINFVPPLLSVAIILLLATSLILFYLFTRVMYSSIVEFRVITNVLEILNRKLTYPSETNPNTVITLTKPVEDMNISELENLIKWAEEVEEFEFAKLLSDQVKQLKK